MLNLIFSCYGSPVSGRGYCLNLWVVGCCLGRVGFTRPCPLTQKEKKRKVRSKVWLHELVFKAKYRAKTLTSLKLMRLKQLFEELQYRKIVGLYINVIIHPSSFKLAQHKKNLISLNETCPKRFQISQNVIIFIRALNVKRSFFNLETATGI
ncbi:uncharacterized protein DS421_5g145800 [Arachis hypogaea]|nr:uncharacterized protein DS421_5g145800 [Arachis hypogaea]